MRTSPEQLELLPQEPRPSVVNDRPMLVCKVCGKTTDGPFREVHRELGWRYLKCVDGELILCRDCDPGRPRKRAPWEGR